MTAGRSAAILPPLVLFTAALAWCVIVLGAYVRLSDAGLGCPDWPGCYGHLGAPHTVEQLQAASLTFPRNPVHVGKAWKEMIHRYLAAALGVSVLTIFVLSRRRGAVSAPLPAALLGLVVFQAVLGMWTVTGLLKPAIVTAHLLGGMGTLALLSWLGLRLLRPAQTGGAEEVRALRLRAGIGLALVAAQIALGGWTSSNYAALACGDSLNCRGEWFPPMDFTVAFELMRELGQRGDGGPLPLDALTAIHWTHRLGALVVSGYLLWLAAQSARIPGLGRLRAGVVALLLAQIALGAGMVGMGFPLAAAVAHNGVAALLLVSLVAFNFRLRVTEGGCS
jgi:cytochrome c oxidase assembly protein subunit 15